MESLNLNTLVSSLPPGQQNAEKELLNNFKAAALSITTLYRSSRKNSKRAYNLGYAAACQDMLNFIQQGVSASGELGEGEPGPSSAVDGGGMTIGRVMDWTEARLDAIKALEEDEDEDEERENQKDHQRKRGAGPSATTTTNVVQSTSSAYRKPAMPSSDPHKISSSTLPTPSSPITQTNAQLPEPCSPSPPPSAPRSTQLQLRFSKSHRPSSKSDQPIPFAAQSANIPQSSFMFTGEPHGPPSPQMQMQTFSEPPIVSINAGAKRRHAMMMMLESASSPGPSSSSPASHGGGFGNGVNGGSVPHRRRTRSTRNLAHGAQSQNQNVNTIVQSPSEAMDVEEEGRERKRVARR
ncbi:hypothetical protein FA15DRAFT_709956 [Coprinopsis marcescibilis]|uniref:Uncharacterized protein n=1 Tax=Coprinopsis marcescibilis TaxID=230819 RepID=A0A5C3KE84_COPMA|nr:hypothetical protein FA15DRAFT_709956 [Coprinopsis marcescibilis]